MSTGAAATMRVYHRQHTGRPIRAVWTLEELGAPYELIAMSTEEGLGEEHRSRHPLGRVPVLDDGEGYIFESAAICLQLADMHPEAGLAPAPGTHERGLTYQWSVFAPAELEPVLIEAMRYAERDPERSASARKRFDAAADAVSKALGDQQYLIGGRFSIADVLIGSVLRFTKRGKFLDQLPTNLIAYAGRLEERPAFQRAAERVAGAEAALKEAEAAPSA
jgi:glutathione S-transferase